MDFLTALGTISKSGLALLATMESSADPSRVAIFETYRGVISMNARMGEAEKVLLAVHQDVSNIPATLREALHDQEARKATSALRAVAEGQLTAYERYIDNIGSDELSLDRAHEIYSEDLERRFDRLEEAIIQVIDTAPLALDEVLAGIAMEIYFLRREGNSSEAIKSTIDARFERLNEAVENSLNPMVAEANAQLMSARSAVEADTNLSDWTASGPLVFYPASFRISWSSQALFVSCVHVTQTELDADRGLYLLEMLSPFPLYETFSATQQVGDSVGQHSFATCGTTFSAKTSEGARGSLYPVSTSVAVEGRRIDFVETHPQAPDGFVRFNVVHDERSKRVANLNTLLEQANLATTRYAILVEYRDNLLAAMSETQRNLEQYATLAVTEELDKSFLAEIEHLGTALGESSRDGRIFEIGRQEAALEDAILRRQLVEAAMAADRQIAAGQARFQAEIEASQSNDNALLRNFLKQIGLGVRVFKAAETAYKRVRSFEEQLAGASPDDRYDVAAAREALSKLENLGIPSEPPTSSELTAQEVAAQQFLEAAFAGDLEVLAEKVAGAVSPTEVTKVVLRDASNAPGEIIEMRGVAERYLLAIIGARMN
ncbi:hypothetical protein FHY55_19530 [Oceanicola sp. D3]|uniref:hypothetical protein n=1 Tax=Oceanicola sp. D3 TaxID=2587163 RepID=UPI0011200350|nr:hypothetical protein [Oceanicola sp. D3]QDC11289.1 hypothetical protein FHY55_19530 [Oceanicola sp. D3]